MADELVRIKIQDETTTQGVEGVLIQVFDGSNILKAQGRTSAGPIPALGIFETTLPGAASPGNLFTLQVQRDIPGISKRAQIRVVT